MPAIIIINIIYYYLLYTSSEISKHLVAQTVKRLPTMRETWVRSLGREDPLEEEMATRSSTLAWKFHGQRKLAGYSPWVCKELNTI